MAVGKQVYTRNKFLCKVNMGGTYSAFAYNRKFLFNTTTNIIISEDPKERIIQLVDNAAEFRL